MAVKGVAFKGEKETGMGDPPELFGVDTTKGEREEEGGLGAWEGELGTGFDRGEETISLFAEDREPRLKLSTLGLVAGGVDGDEGEPPGKGE